MFHNGSKYDYHFIIKELVEELEGQSECLGESAEKYINFSVPTRKELENGKTITYKIKLIDSLKLIPSSLSSLVDNLSEGLLNYKSATCKPCLDYISTKDNQLVFKCTECSKNHKNHFNKNLIKRSENTYEFFDRDINKFILLLRKGV